MNIRRENSSKSDARDAGRAAGDAPSSVQFPKPRIRVLIADDHGVVREGLVSMIKRNRTDMTVVGEASNGREAVQFWKQERPDVTLLDLRMPELDGVEVIKEIRAAD